MKKWTRALLFVPVFLCLPTFGCGEPAPATPEQREANLSDADRAAEAELTKKTQENQAKLDAKKR
jgi:hypothetical protein